LPMGQGKENKNANGTKTLGGKVQEKRRREFIKSARVKEFLFVVMSGVTGRAKVNFPFP